MVGIVWEENEVRRERDLGGSFEEIYYKGIIKIILYKIRRLF